MPQALTTEEIELAETRIIEAIHANPKLTTKAAVEQAGISRATFYRLMAHRKGFGQRIREAQAAARQAALDDLEEHLFERSADPKNPTGCTSAIFLLKGNRPGLYAERQPRGLNPGNFVVHITEAQINLAGQTVDEMRRLEGPSDEPDPDSTRLEADEFDVWAVRQ